MKAVLLILSYIMLYCIVSATHEPWFDEAQAWQIGKCASWWDILFVVPHYEGHPPLWHLILALPAKAGIPFELGIKSIGLILSSIAAMLFFLQSPFPLPVRILLPFSFFFFYQYGVIVRPYALMLLTLILLALFFPKKDYHPWFFTGLLGLLCLTSAYGMLIAGGIAVCMAWDLYRAKGTIRFVSELLSDQRTASMLVLLVFAILLTSLIVPRQDTLVTSRERRNSIFLCLICSILTFLPECLITTSSWFSEDASLLQHSYIPITELLLISVIGIVIWLVIIAVSPKGKLKYFVVPYSMLALFSAVVYFGGHHIGIPFLLLLFWTWIAFDDENRFEVGRRLLRFFGATSRDYTIAKAAVMGLASVCIFISLLWTTLSIVAEIRSQYSYGREVSRFLKEYSLDNGLLLCAWEDITADNLPSTQLSSESTEYGSRAMAVPVVIDAYFDGNIFYCLNNGRDDEAYFQYRIDSDQSLEQLSSQWIAAGIPDVLLGRPTLEEVFGKAITYDDYELVDICEYGGIWKGNQRIERLPLYVRKDILVAHHLDKTHDPYAVLYDGLVIDDDMRQRFESGTPVEEILAPYLDEVFG